MAHHQQGFVEVPEDSDMNMNDANSGDESESESESAAPTIKSLERQLAAAKKEMSAKDELLATQDTRIHALEVCEEDQARLFLAAMDKITRLNLEGASPNLTRYMEPPKLVTYWTNQVSLQQAQATRLEVKKAKVEEDSITAMNKLRDLTSRVNTMQLQLNVEQLNVEHNQNKVVFQRGSQANIIINLAPGQTYTTPDGAVLAYPTPSPTPAIDPTFGQAPTHGLRHPAIRPDLPPMQQRSAPEANGMTSSSGSTLRRRPNAPITDHVLRDASRVTKHGGFNLPFRSGAAPARRPVQSQTVATKALALTQALAVVNVPKEPRYSTDCKRKFRCGHGCGMVHDDQRELYRDIIAGLPAYTSKT